MHINIEAIYLSSGHDFRGRHGKVRLDHGIQSVDSVSCRAGMGLEGDRYYGHEEDFKGQITFFDYATVEAIKEQFDLGELEPSLFRRNIITSGVDLNTLIRTRFTIQGIAFEGSEECRPCYWMDQAIAPGAEEALKGRGGLRARILGDGILRIGTRSLEMNPAPAER